MYKDVTLDSLHWIKSKNDLNVRVRSFLVIQKVKIFKNVEIHPLSKYLSEHITAPPSHQINTYGSGGS